MENLITWLEAHQMPCLYKHYLGVQCPGCGMQTAIILLLKGEFIESLNAYPALLPTFFLIIFLVLHLIFKYKHGASILKYVFTFTVAVMIVSYLFHIAEKYF
jgi:hypothetical protein